MKLAYVTTYNPLDINKWSGLSYYIAQALKNQSLALDYIGPLRDRLAVKMICKLKRHYYNFSQKTYLKDPEPLMLKDYTNQISNKLSKITTDIIFGITSRPIAYLDCKQPIAFWTDATFAGLLNFYPHYSNLCQETVANWNLLENYALRKCSLAIYSSEWAAQTAIDSYNINPSKVKVVPFGANLENIQTISEAKDLIESRPSNCCNLLFLGVDWFRKGGDIAFKVSKALNQAGIPTELTVVGCEPILDEPLPNYVKPLGFISKSTVEGKEKLSQLLAKSHFLILPSRAECFGVVFCEASSFGVPSLVARTGGIESAVRDNINGKVFDQDADVSQYCHYISNLLANYSAYKTLALSSFREYQSRLNWSVSGQAIKQMLLEL